MSFNLFNIDLSVKLPFLKRRGDILIVEDNQSESFLLRTYLERIGKGADEVKTAEEAKGALNNKKYSIVFIDIRLPLMNGVELVKYITECHPRVKNVIVLGEVHDLDKFPSGMFISLIKKPVNKESLQRCLNVLK